ncbi:hypothetical protein [Tunicatimonas pelagia]|uniref:hypothetical protein n=1 Tax=Tunicatimonas pelagia TaxID=931531 RepID=UPI002666EC0F|nr:hypothetical protein [Tunicatimonas pelagia]WKN41452.1 hypothetical protein P0M28_20660 [Tunicatimonas pelagia]
MRLLILFVSFLFFLKDTPADPYIFSSEITGYLQAEDTNFAYHKAAWQYSFIGNYQQALWAFEQVGVGYPDLSEEEKIRFSLFRPTPADDYILAQAEREQIVIINEAHHQPMHRVFTTSLLEGLYKRGYRFLGLEALAHSDTLLNQRGYPVLGSGYYTQEPQFGNLVRKALKLGFTVFPYETQIQVNGKEREIQQARNIEHMVKANPDAKFLIHCGFGHVVESEVPGWEKAMAGRVKEHTGINPLTINQEILTEHFSRETENPYFQLVDTLDYPAVFINANDEVFHGGKGDNRFDVRLFHPRTTFTNGRPSWLLMSRRRYLCSISDSTITIDYPVLVKAYAENESDEAVPIDVIELPEYHNQKSLVLPEGKFSLRITNPQGDSLTADVEIPVD